MAGEESRVSHTAGPWEGTWQLVKAFGSDIANIVKACDSRMYPDNERFTVCVVDPESQMNADLVESYAHLIAAAPELLEALKDMILLFDDAREGCLLLERADHRPMTNGDQQIIDSAFIKATIAIRKAKGE